ncbi:MAG: Gfo/Idh/MocA family protein [Lachnospirales bacterium]
MEKKLRMGVLGLGEGRSIISAVMQSDYWEIGNICDLNEDLCKEQANAFALSQYTLDYEEMLKDENIDVIGIYTPDQLHAEHILMALKAGKDVICTKPVMVDLDRANELLAVQKETGKLVFIGQSSRYFEPMLHQRADYNEGKHGELVTMEAHYMSDSRWFLEKAWSHQKGFSWMYNFMIHAVDLTAWYLPNVEEVYGAGVVSANTKAFGLNVPDTLKFILTDKSGISATVSGIYATPALGNDTEASINCTLRGTDGVSRANYPRLKYLTKFDKKQKQVDIHDFNDKHKYYFRFEGESHHAGEYQNYIEDFAKCKAEGKTPLPDLKEAVRTLAIMEAMELSVETGQVIRVSDVLKNRDINI